MSGDKQLDMREVVKAISRAYPSAKGVKAQANGDTTNIFFESSSGQSYLRMSLKNSEVEKYTSFLRYIENPGSEVVLAGPDDPKPETSTTVQNMSLPLEDQYGNELPRNKVTGRQVVTRQKSDLSRRLIMVPESDFPRVPSESGTMSMVLDDSGAFAGFASDEGAHPLQVKRQIEPRVSIDSGLDVFGKPYTGQSDILVLNDNEDTVVCVNNKGDDIKNVTLYTGKVTLQPGVELSGDLFSVAGIYTGEDATYEISEINIKASKAFISGSKWFLIPDSSGPWSFEYVVKYKGAVVSTVNQSGWLDIEQATANAPDHYYGESSKEFSSYYLSQICEECSHGHTTYQATGSQTNGNLDTLNSDTGKFKFTPKYIGDWSYGYRVLCDKRIISEGTITGTLTQHQTKENSNDE